MSGSNTPPNPSTVDFTTEQADAIELYQPAEKEYNPSQDRENVRSKIALGLFALLAIVIHLSFLALYADLIKKEDLRDLLTIVFGPLITLLGAVTGFYYGEKSTSNR